MSLSDDADDPDHCFEFLKLLKAYIINQTTEDQVMQFMAINPGHQFMDQLSRMEQILRFNSYNTESTQITQSQVGSQNQFTYADLQILMNMKTFNYSEALKQLDVQLLKMEQSGKTNPSILNLAGIVFLFQNKLKQARKIYAQILEVKPHDLAAISNYACVLLRLGEMQKAILLYQRVMNCSSGVVKENSKNQLYKIYKQLEEREQSAELRKYYQQRWKQLGAQ